MTNDFMLLFPVILVSLGGIALMLAATCHCFRDEQAAWACGGLFGLAFLVQLGATLTGGQPLFPGRWSGNSGMRPVHCAQLVELFQEEQPERD